MVVKRREFVAAPSRDEEKKFLVTETTGLA
jgi:hypothetical protein